MVKDFCSSHLTSKKKERLFLHVVLLEAVFAPSVGGFPAVGAPCGGAPGPDHHFTLILILYMRRVMNLMLLGPL